MKRAGFILIAAVALAGCGKRQSLVPASGKALPVKPATSPTQPDADALLASPSQLRPGRSDELLTKSSVRPDDHFDLPPR
jgi:hypothetical protein